MLLKLFYESLRGHTLVVCWPIYRAVYKTRFYYEDEETKENRYIRGGAMIVSNHYSGLDYIVTLYKYFGRKIHVVMLDYMFNKSAFMRWSINIMGGIPAGREDRRLRFMDEGIRLMAEGGILQIYPEADSAPDGGIRPFSPTYILMALRAGVPIVPLVVDGQYHIRTRAHAIVGKSIRLGNYCGTADPSREEIERLNEIVRGRVIELKEELDRRKAAEETRRHFRRRAPR